MVKCSFAKIGDWPPSKVPLNAEILKREKKHRPIGLSKQRLTEKKCRKAVPGREKQRNTVGTLVPTILEMKNLFVPFSSWIHTWRQRASLKNQHWVQGVLGILWDPVTQSAVLELDAAKEGVRHTQSQTPPQVYWIRVCSRIWIRICYNKSPGVIVCTFKFQEHCSRTKYA